MSKVQDHSTYSAPLRISGGLGVLAFLGELAGRLVDTVLTWLERDRDRRALLALDDRLLRDIGVSRSQVEEEVAKPFWRA